MKLLLCHNYYQQRGGEDQSFELERDLLESRGHSVISFTVHNNTIPQMSRATLLAKTIWNRSVYVKLRSLIRQHRPDVMHCTNLFPLISPAASSAALTEQVPVVQSLRNYRMFCSNALFLREGKVCEDCLGRTIPWPAIRHKCYRDSRTASAVVVGLQTIQKVTRSWNHIDLFFTPSEFARNKMIEGGLSPEQLAVKPNFLDPEPGVGSGSGDYVIYVGRLSPEKGISTLLEAWKHDPDLPKLMIVGNGPEKKTIQTAQESDQRIQLMGQLPLERALDLIGESQCLVMPSIWYETFGRTVIEAYAKGAPVVASRIGALTELVEGHETGLLFEPGNSNSLSASIKNLLDNPLRMTQMRKNARDLYKRNFTAERNYLMLMRLYSTAIQRHSRRAS